MFWFMLFCLVVVLAIPMGLIYLFSNLLARFLAVPTQEEIQQDRNR